MHKSLYNDCIVSLLHYEIELVDFYYTLLCIMILLFTKIVEIFFHSFFLRIFHVDDKKSVTKMISVFICDIILLIGCFLELTNTVFYATEFPSCELG